MGKLFSKQDHKVKDKGTEEPKYQGTVTHRLLTVESYCVLVAHWICIGLKFNLNSKKPLQTWEWETKEKHSGIY